jgi:hypothetical protein
MSTSTHERVVRGWLAQPAVARVMALVEDGSIAGALAAELERLRAELARVRAVADALLAVTGEVDDDGAFVPCPQASLTMAVREALAPWVEGAWRTLAGVVRPPEAPVPLAVEGRCTCDDFCDDPCPHHGWGQMECACGERVRAPLVVRAGWPLVCPDCGRGYVGVEDGSHGHWEAQP